MPNTQFNPQPNEFDFLVSDALRVQADPLPVERVFLTLHDGRTLSALRFGTSEQTPEYAILHGAGLHAHSFDPMIFALGIPALAIDLPGHGQSSWRSDANYQPSTMAPDIITALEHWTDRAVPLIGHSLGGLTALTLTNTAPELVTHTVVIDITPTVVMGAAAATVAEFITGQRSFENVEEMVDRAIDFGIGTDRDALLRGVTLNSQVRADGRIEWIHHFAHLDGLPSAPSTLELPDIPHTLIRATDGLVLEHDLRQWREQFPSSNLVEIPGPHNLHESAPKQLAAEIQAVIMT